VVGITSICVRIIAGCPTAARFQLVRVTVATAAKRHEERATISWYENTLAAVLTRWLIVVSLLAFRVVLPISGPRLVKLVSYEYQA